MLLSGRCCTCCCSLWMDMNSLLHQCSEKLELDTEEVLANGKLVHLGDTEATDAIRSLEELQPGKMHCLTLVLSSQKKGKALQVACAAGSSWLKPLQNKVCTSHFLRAFEIPSAFANSVKRGKNSGPVTGPS